MTPYYEESGITIYHGDCMEIMPAMDDNTVEITVTSPPYNMGLQPGGNGRGMYRPRSDGHAGRLRDGYEQHDDAMLQTDYDAWQRACLAEMWRVSQHGVFYNHRPRVEHGVLRMPLSLDFGIPLRQIIVWDRGTGVDVNLRHFCTRQEWVLLFAKPEFALIDHAASGMGDVWRDGIDRSRLGHPAPFPLAIPTRALTATGAASVLDPFMGSGTTLRAAKNLGRRAIGIDTSERYCEIAARRLSQEVLDFDSSDDVEDVASS